MDIATLFQAILLQAIFLLGTADAIAAITTNALFDTCIRNFILRGRCPLD